MNNQDKSFRKFLLLWSGEFISAIGGGLTSFGLGVFVFQQTGKASAAALVTLLALLPTLLLSPLAGVLADRYDRRILILLGDILSALGLVFILVCMLVGEAQLWEICVGVFISAVFSSLLDPAYKATITDLLTEEQYTKASGLVQVAGSAKYLISPIVAGFLLAVADIKLLLIIDICTILVTVPSVLVVRKGLATKRNDQQPQSLIREFKEGWLAVSANRGVLALVLMGSVIMFFIGFIESLFTPMILSFSTSSTLGTVQTIAASGMLVTSMVLGFIPIKKGYVKILSVSLGFAGLFMFTLGLRENIVLICLSGFLFFTMLPFTNTCLDYLLRTNIENELQGRAWGLIGVISQIGFVAAYGLAGVLADYVFNPLLVDGGFLADSVGRLIGTGSGRGIGLLISVVGVLLSVTAAVLYRIQSVKTLEKHEQRGDVCIAD